MLGGVCRNLVDSNGPRNPLLWVLHLSSLHPLPIFHFLGCSIVPFHSPICKNMCNYNLQPETNTETCQCLNSARINHWTCQIAVLEIQPYISRDPMSINENNKHHFPTLHFSIWIFERMFMFDFPLPTPNWNVQIEIYGELESCKGSVRILMCGRNTPRARPYLGSGRIRRGGHFEAPHFYHPLIFFFHSKVKRSDRETPINGILQRMLHNVDEHVFEFQNSNIEEQWGNMSTENWTMTDW